MSTKKGKGHTISSLLEIGGGYGYILRDILHKYNRIKAVSVDISRYCIQKQKEIQKEFTVSYINNDIFSMKDDFFQKFDMALLNENMGDFPTVVNINGEMCELACDDEMLSRINEFVVKYGFSIPEIKNYNFNIGACEIIERLCRNKIKYIFASEHSCEPIVSEMIDGKIKVTKNANPEQIRLKGHYEYTVQFSHLQKIAQYHGYRIIRGNYTDFIKLDCNDKLNFIINSNSQKDEHEIVRQFLEDLLKYEYIILIKNNPMILYFQNLSDE